jgi:glycosyltransferase involved in cell wall biosynthesis
MIVGIDARAANTAVPLGVGVYCQELLRAMVALPGAPALRLYLDTAPSAAFPVSAGKADIRVLPKSKAWATRRLARELRQNPPDVFFAPVMQVPFGVPCPVVTTIHGLPFRKYGASPNPLRRTWTVARTMMALWRCDRIIAISDSMKTDMTGVLRTPPHRIAVVHHGCSPGFRPDPESGELARVRDRYHLPESYLLYCGRIGMHKNLVRLIEAYAAVRTTNPELSCKLVLAGSLQEDSNEVKAAAERSPAHDDIVFAGYVERGDLPAVMAGATALALVSLWESFGMPALEAMATGTPVIASNCGALPEICGDAAILVDPCDVRAIKDGLEVILTNEVCRDSLRQKGLARASQFSWEKTAQETLDVIEAARDARAF